jgi:hypothetical protein
VAFSIASFICAIVNVIARLLTIEINAKDQNNARDSFTD